MAKNERIYIVNGKETDEFGEEIKHKNRTGAKMASKTVSILLSVSLAAVLAAGAIIPASIIINNTQEKNIETIATVTPKEEKEYNILLCDGMVIKADKDYVSTVIYNQDNLCVDGVYYSDTEDQLVLVEASYNKKVNKNGKIENIIIVKKYLLTPEEYANNLQEILSSNGEVKNYSAKIVLTKPLSDLYDLLGLEQPKADKLTK